LKGTAMRNLIIISVIVIIIIVVLKKLMPKTSVALDARRVKSKEALLEKIARFDDSLSKKIA
jgi:hypothetical protein